MPGMVHVKQCGGPLRTFKDLCYEETYNNKDNLEALLL